jgi:hypothetical protein
LEFIGKQLLETVEGENVWEALPVAMFMQSIINDVL